MPCAVNRLKTGCISLVLTAAFVFGHSDITIGKLTHFDNGTMEWVYAEPALSSTSETAAAPSIFGNTGSIQEDVLPIRYNDSSAIIIKKTTYAHVKSNIILKLRN
ncbi:hypothetical protein FACS1894172_05480 [Spirochaetia bacterium]|nr:hypothetical protein FACS1894172_05480 [Spirochaetia bacterium]